MNKPMVRFAAGLSALPLVAACGHDAMDKDNWVIPPPVVEAAAETASVLIPPVSYEGYLSMIADVIVDPTDADLDALPCETILVNTAIRGEGVGPEVRDGWTAAFRVSAIEEDAIGTPFGFEELSYLDAEQGNERLLAYSVPAGVFTVRVAAGEIPNRDYEIPASWDTLDYVRVVVEECEELPIVGPSPNQGLEPAERQQIPLGPIDNPARVEPER